MTGLLHLRMCSRGKWRGLNRILPPKRIAEKFLFFVINCNEITIFLNNFFRNGNFGAGFTYYFPAFLFADLTFWGCKRNSKEMGGPIKRFLEILENFGIVEENFFLKMQ